MGTPGAAGGFFSGLLGGVSEGVTTALKQKHDDELKKNAMLSQVYLKAVENGDLEPQHGIPLVANILSGSFSALTGDKKGSKKDKSMFTELLGDPEKLSGLLLGFHQATNSSPASGPSGPTGLPTAGPTGAGGGLEGSQSGPEAPLASRSGVSQGLPRTSIFRSSADRQREADTALTHSEDIRRKSNVQQAGDIEQVKYDTKLKTAQRMVADGIAKDLPEALERVGLKEPKPPPPPKVYAPGSPAAMVQDELDAFEQANDRKPTSAERVKISEGVLKQIQADKRQSKSPLGSGAEDERTKQVLAREGVPLDAATPEQITSARKTAAGELQAVEKAQLANARRLAEGGAHIQVKDVKANAQSVKVGDQTKSYINLGDYEAKERAAARDSALEAGITPLLPAQAVKVEDAANATENAQLMLDQIRDKLPKDYKGRPWASLRNLTFKQIQADDALASYKAWGIAAMPIVRAMGALGRVTNVELAQAKDALPKETDTVGVAGEKTEILTGMLQRSMNRMLTRGEPMSGGSSSRASTVPPAVSTLLKGKKPGPYKLSDGSEWVVGSDGSVTPKK